MRVPISLLTLCVSVATSVIATAPAHAAKTRVVVYKLTTADKTLAPMAAQLSDDLAISLGKSAGIVVLTESEIKVMLRHEKDKESLMCADNVRCLAKLQQAVQAEKVVTGHLGRLGDEYVVTLKLMDVKRAVVERAEAAQAGAAPALAVALREAGRRLLGIAGGGGPRFVMKVAPQGTKAAVIDLRAHGVKPELAKNLTELLSLELKKFDGLGVISRDEIKTMLRFERDKGVLTCKDATECLVEIGGALGVDYLVTGSVGKLGAAYVVSLKLMDVHGAKVASRVSESLRGAEGDLPLALRFAAWKMLGKPLAGKGKLRVRANVDEGKLTIAGLKPTGFPLEAPLAGLSAGKVGVALKAPGFYPAFQETFVFDGQDTQLSMKLIEMPKPWYEQWWPWTIIGVAVLGAATATAVVLMDQPTAGDVKVNVAPR